MPVFFHACPFCVGLVRSIYEVSASPDIAARPHATAVRPEDLSVDRIERRESLARICRGSVAIGAHRPCRRKSGRAVRVGQSEGSDLDRLGYCPGVFKFDPKGANGAVHLRVPEQQLDGPKVSSLAVDLSDLGAAHRVRAVRTGLEAYRRDPVSHEAGVLSGRDVRPFVEASPARDTRTRPSADRQARQPASSESLR